MKKSIFSILMAGGLFLNSCSDSNETQSTSQVITNLEKGVLEGRLNKSLTLTKPRYKLTGAFIIENNAELTIPKGTKIEASSSGSDVYIAVRTGSKINIKGAADAPVVISSKAGAAGDWGGLVICGKAITTAGEEVAAEVGGFTYGGKDKQDNSGKITYLVLKGTGAQINAESQYNGISFYAVGAKTVVENISVINGADDGIEFFGGSVSVKNIYLKDNEDDSVDWTEGWEGTLTNTYIVHTKDGFSTALEGDKENNNPQFVNLTAISTAGSSAKSQTALQFKKQSGATITNLWLEGYTQKIDMKDKGPLKNVQIEGANADPTQTYQKQKIDISLWKWKEAHLN